MLIMSIKNELEKALEEFNLLYITRGSTKGNCIVYNYISTPKNFSDNKVESYEYTILLNVIVSSKVEYTNELIRKKLMDNKFYKIMIQKPLLEEDGFFNTPIQCKKIILHKEDI